MRMLVVALQRTVGRWVTVHAARMRQHLGSLCKNARERSAGSEIAANAAGACKVLEVCA
jgi:hypothetical protein